MTMKKMKKLCALLALLASAGAAQAAPLLDRGNGMIYDADRDLTWLADWNAGAGSIYDNGFSTSDGKMTWGNANDWANSLVHGGFGDWRLPTALSADGTVQCGGVNCTGSELGHMFYEHLGGNANESVLVPTGDTAEEIANLALFTNVQSGSYWSGTEFTTGANAWVFSIRTGEQDVDGHRVESYAVAVRPGDVAAGIPEPQTLGLVGLALGAAVFGLRKRPV